MTSAKNSILYPALIMLLLSTTLVWGDNVDSIGEAIMEGIPTFEFRLGFEYSSTDDSNSPGKALNLRSRVGYRTADYYDTNAFVQFHSLLNFVEEFFYSGGGDRDRDTILDPDGERIHQVYLEYKGVQDLKLRLGRQEITLDDQRLIGNIDWRQNGQSFDAISMAYQPLPELHLFGAISNKVTTINLNSIDLEHLILLNLHYTHEETHHLGIYTYLRDDEENDKDSFTYGIRTNGIFEDLIKYDIGCAWQNDYQGSNNRNAGMVSLFLGLQFDQVNLGMGYNRLSGMDGKDKPFDTLFGTAHKFNGWADQFAGSNGGNIESGLQDLYLQFGTEIMFTKFLFRYHFFDTTESGDDVYSERYGDEINFDISRDITEELTLQIRAAFYNKTNKVDGTNSNPTKDEDVFWARLLYNF